MTVSSLELKTIVISAGETSFAYFFPVADTADVKVYFTVAGADYLQTDYTVDSTDLEQGGNVIFDTAPPVGTKITIVREISLTQDTNYVENDPFPAEAHEDALDKLTMIVQQIDEKADRSIHFPVSDNIAIAADLPDLDTRKLKFLYFDQDGQITAAEGQLIESSHTHTYFPTLTISGLFTSDYEANFNYITTAQAHFYAHVEMDTDLYVAADIYSDGNITSTMDIYCVNLHAVSGTVDNFTITDTLEVGNLITDTMTLAGDLDVPGLITVGDNDGLTISSISNLSRLNSTNASEHLCAKIVLTTTDSDDLGGYPHDYFSTDWDPTYGYLINLGGAVVGKNFRATDWAAEVPIFQSDYNAFFATGESMIFSINMNADIPSQSFRWGHAGWGDDHTTIMTLTASGVLNVDGEIQVWETPVSLEGHTHSDITDSITSVSGALQSQIDNLDNTYATDVELATVSGALNSKIDTIQSTQGGLIYWLANTASDIGGYELMLTAPSSGTVDVDTKIITSTSGVVLIGSYITASGTPNTTIIPAGIWDFEVYGEVDNINANTYFIARVYKYTVSGTETLLFSTQSASIENTTTAPIYFDTYQQAFSLNGSDRLVCKIYGQTTSSQNITLRYYYQGTETYSHFHTPVQVIVVGNHGLLEGLGDDDHPQYLLKTDFTVASGNIVNQIPTDFATDSDLAAVSGSIMDTITTVSGDIVSQIPTDYYTQSEVDDVVSTASGSITTSGVLYGPQVDTLYFGNPTTSGTWRLTVADGKMALQLYNGAIYETATTWSGVG